MIMNKRFSTLLAAALVAGGLSFNANADSYLPWSDIWQDFAMHMEFYFMRRYLQPGTAGRCCC